MARRINVLDLMSLTAQIRVLCKDKLHLKDIYDKVELFQGKNERKTVFYLRNKDGEDLAPAEGLSYTDMHTFLSGMLCFVNLMVQK